MDQWLESVYSDGSAYFVSNPEPVLFETVTIRIRMYEDAPVRHVLLRSVPNGIEQLTEMKLERQEKGLKYYAAELKMTENRIRYHFYLVCDDIIYYYNQKEITTYVPDQVHDFVLLADYRQPAWVKDAVFYQIFPDRFCNGDPGNDVKDGEYKLSGHPTIHRKWDEKPLQYQQGYCLDFFGGDLQGITQKIPYLKELGVTALYINPIFTAPTAHKYDCLDYFHVDEHFGGDKALEELSKALHENGMKLIIDISINHTGISHKWFNKDGEFFDLSEGGYNNPDAPERSYYFFHEDNSYVEWMGVPNLPTLNYTSDALRDIIYRREDSVLRKWLKEPYCIDGWRFDVADVFARNNEVQLAHELWPQIRQAIRQKNPQAYILAEDWGDCAGYLQGDEWDSPMNYYGFGRVIRQFLGEPDLFHARHAVLRNVPYKMTGMDFKARVMEHLSQLPFVFWQNQFNLYDSHDTPRLHNNPAVHPEEYRGALIFQFAIIGAPSVYYGDEAEIDGWIENNEGCRFPMPWDKDFEKLPIYQLIHRLAGLRHEHLALTHGGMKFLCAEKNVVSIARFTAEEAIVAVMSVGEETEEVILPLGTIGAAAPAGNCDLLGRQIHWRKLDENRIALTMEPHAAYLFRCEMKQ